jgi:hypothetical protein
MQAAAQPDKQPSEIFSDEESANFLTECDFSVIQTPLSGAAVVSGLSFPQAVEILKLSPAMARWRRCRYWLVTEA